MSIAMIELMKKYVLNKSKDEVKIEIIESSIFFHLASIANIAKGVRYNRHGELKDRIVNYFGIVLAGSGAGKDLSMDSVEELFTPYIEPYGKRLSSLFHSRYANVADTVLLDSLKENYAIPTGLKTSIEGTGEGFQKLMQGMSILPEFSINIVHGEFGDILMNASMITRLKEAWTHGSGKGKTTASGGYFDVIDIPVNVSLHGAPYGIQSDRVKLEKLKEEIIQGFGRRSFIYLQPVSKIIPNAFYKTMDNSDKNDLHTLCETFFSFSKTGRTLTISEEAAEVLDSYIAGLKDNYNNGDLHNKIKHSLVGSETKIERLSCIIAMADLSEIIYPEHVEYAIDFANRTNECMEEIVRGYPVHVDIFNRISTVPQSRVDLVQNISALSAVKNFNDYMGLTKEYAISNGCVVKEEGDSVKMYHAVPLPLTNLAKMIVSINVDKAKSVEQSIDFKPIRIPFLGDGQSVESLVRSNVGCFTLAHYEPTEQATHGHRKAEHFISGQNMIAIDIDSGLPLSTAKVLLKDFLCLIYTTKSHQKEGKGDRYRIVMPTNKEYFVTAEQHKEMMDNVAKILGVEIYDRQTRNVSRLWYTNETGELWVNKKDKLFDVTSCIPSMESSKKLMSQMDDVEVLNLDSRIDGVYRWFFLTTAEGNRNESLFRVVKLMKDLSVDSNEIEDHATKMNAMLDIPLHESEVRTIIRSGLNK